MNVDLSKVDFAGLAAAARRERTHAMGEFLFSPVAQLVLRLARPEPRKPSAVFQSIRGC
ncbi:MAG TPA: hypothetical protein VGI18_13995 [Burkholderiales bacterium]|jgi:hypothetical protein